MASIALRSPPFGEKPDYADQEVPYNPMTKPRKTGGPEHDHQPSVQSISKSFSQYIYRVSSANDQFDSSPGIFRPIKNSSMDRHFGGKNYRGSHRSLDPDSGNPELNEVAEISKAKVFAATDLLNRAVADRNSPKSAMVAGFNDVQTMSTTLPTTRKNRSTKRSSIPTIVFRTRTTRTRTRTRTKPKVKEVGSTTNALAATTVSSHVRETAPVSVKLGTQRYALADTSALPKPRKKERHVRKLKSTLHTSLVTSTKSRSHPTSTASAADLPRSSKRNVGQGSLRRRKNSVTTKIFVSIARFATRRRRTISPRPNTTAASMPQYVGKKRSKKLTPRPYAPSLS